MDNLNKKMLEQIGLSAEEVEKALTSKKKKSKVK